MTDVEIAEEDYNDSVGVESTFDDNAGDDSNETNERGEHSVQERTKRISEKDVFAITLRDMIEITPVNRKLYKSVIDHIYFLDEENNLLSPGTSNNASAASSPKHEKPIKNKKPPPKKKAILIQEEAQLKRDMKKVTDLSMSANNIIIAISRVRDPTIQQIIQWLRTANDVPVYIALICGAILEKLMEIDNINLSIELYPYWMDALEMMQTEIGDKQKVLSPMGILCKKIKSDNIKKWRRIMVQFEHQLRHTPNLNIENRKSWLYYQLEEVEGVQPNTLYDIATYRAELSIWQLELLKSLWEMARRQDITNNGGLLVHSTTTSGKTTLVLFSLSNFIKYDWKVVYLAPNEMLAMQCAAVLQQTSKLSISVYTENLALYQPNADVTIIVPGYQPQEFDPPQKMILIMDECHVINEPQYSDYKDLVEGLAPATDAIIGLSATLPNADQFIMQLEELFNTKFATTGTTNRPVRMRLFDGMNQVMHPWGLQENNRNGGLAAPDIKYALESLSVYNNDILKNLDNTEIIQKIMLEKCTIDRIDTSCLENWETNMLTVIKAEPELGDKCFNNKYKTDTSIKNLYDVLKTITKKGNVLVFCEDPDLVFELLSQHAARELLDTVEFWNELLTINREFVAKKSSLHTTKYLEALDSVSGMSATGTNTKALKTKDNLLATISSVRKDVDKLHGVRRTKLLTMHSLRKDSPNSNIILEQAEIEPDSVSENYQPHRHLQFGRYSFMEINSVRRLYPSMTESQCRVVTNGIAVMGDFISLPTKISILRAMNERRFNVLISGRTSLALGVNVGVYATVVYDPDDAFLPTELKQMSERSGRKGLDRTGYTTIIRKTAP
jgi:hypothetical protein